MKGVIVLLLVLLVSCGRNQSNQCRSKERMILECRVVNTPNYGHHYAQEMCNRSYQSDRCW